MSEYLDNLIDHNNAYRIITLYPTMAYVFYIFCKNCYDYLLNYNLLVLDIFCDMYDNTYNYETTNIKTNNKETQTENDYYNNILIAFNQIPT